MHCLKKGCRNLMKLLLGISSCLLGERVRYDGGHKLNSCIDDYLGEHFIFRSFCPEVASGLGVPREPIRLVRKSADAAISCVATDDSGRDYTAVLAQCAHQQEDWQQTICGYIVKQGSPSCGMERVKVYGKGRPALIGTGIFTASLMKKFPDLPVEDEGRLGDARLRENFIKRVYVYWRWQDLCTRGLTVAGLIEFHARHKLIIRSHSQRSCRELGAMVSGMDYANLSRTAEFYFSTLMRTLGKIASVRNHVSALQQIQGYLKRGISSADRLALQQSIEHYRLGLLPLSAPLALLNKHAHHASNDSIVNSWYMNPYPVKLGLADEI